MVISDIPPLIRNGLLKNNLERYVQQEVLHVSVEITVEGESGMIVISSESARCFARGAFGRVDRLPSQREEERGALTSMPNTEHNGRADTTPS